MASWLRAVELARDDVRNAGVVVRLYVDHLERDAAQLVLRRLLAQAVLDVVLKGGGACACTVTTSFFPLHHAFSPSMSQPTRIFVGLLRRAAAAAASAVRATSVRSPSAGAGGAVTSTEARALAKPSVLCFVRAFALSSPQPA